MTADNLMYGTSPKLSHRKRESTAQCEPRVAGPGDAVTLQNLVTKKTQVITISKTIENLGPAAKAANGKRNGALLDIPLAHGLVPHKIIKVEKTD